MVVFSEVPDHSLEGLEAIQRSPQGPQLGTRSVLFPNRGVGESAHVPWLIGLGSTDLTKVVLSVDGYRVGVTVEAWIGQRVTYLAVLK